MTEQPGSTGKHIGETCYTPYLASKARQIIIRGDLELGLAKEALAKEGLYPVESSPGRATATIIFNEIIESVVPRPYNEVIFTIDAVKTANVKIKPCCGCGVCSPWNMAYDSFGTVAGNRHFMHTLYVDSTFACDASRQTQAIPKHPQMADMQFTMSSDAVTIDINMLGQPVLKIDAKNAWPACCGICWGRGCCMLNRMALGFFGAFGICKLLGLLTSCNVEFPLTMPEAAAKNSEKEREYGARVRKVSFFLSEYTILPIIL